MTNDGESEIPSKANPKSDVLGAKKQRRAPIFQSDEQQVDPHNLSWQNLASLSGIAVIHKPVGLTSADVVAVIKKQLQAEAQRLQSAEATQPTMSPKKIEIKVGHGGTLDPIAQGVLIVGIGSATKLLGGFLKGEKRYITTAKFGNMTDTYDRSGKVLASKATKPFPEQAIDDLLAREFTGQIAQVPPMYSALKVGGQKLYELARKGIEVEREERVVTVSDARQITAPYLNNELPPVLTNMVQKTMDLIYPPEGFSLDIVSSGGFYVRSYIVDIAARLDSLAYMEDLLRVEQGPFSLFDSILNRKDWTIGNLVSNMKHCYDLLERKGMITEDVDSRFTKFDADGKPVSQPPQPMKRTAATPAARDFPTRPRPPHSPSSATLWPRPNSNSNSNHRDQSRPGQPVDPTARKRWPYTV
jgi:tRNA pseudouridine55 synthase